MTRWVTQLVFLLAPAVGAAQEVRMHVYYGSFEDDAAVLLTPTSVRFVWATGGLNCPLDESLTRTGDHRGRFTSLEQDVFQNCGRGQPLDAAILPSGAFIVMGSGYARVFYPSGVPVGPEFLVTGSLGVTKIGSLGDRFAVTWTELGSPIRIKGRIVMEDASMPYPARELPENTTFDAVAQAVAPTPSGGAFVGWTRDPVSTIGPYEIVGRFFDNSMAPITGDILLDPGGRQAGSLAVAPIPSGYVVTWMEEEPTPGFYDVVARLFDVNGIPTGPKIQVPALPVGSQAFPYVGANPAGRFVITWQSSVGSSGPDVYGQRFSPAGVKLGLEFRINGTTFDYQAPAHVPAVMSDGSFIVPWYSYTDPDGTTGSFFRRYYFPISLLVGGGPGPGIAPMVQAVQGDGLAGHATFPAYGAGAYGANVNTGDIDGGSSDEALTGPGPSVLYGPQVRAFRPDGVALQKVNFYAYGTLRYGARPAGGDIDGDAYAEILSTPGAGAVFGPHVRGWDYDGASLGAVSKVNFYGYQTLKWGARVAGGDIDGDGIREILTAPGPGAAFPPHVRAFDYDGVALTSIGRVNFTAWPSGRYGATVGAADIESDGLGTYGDGFQEIVVGGGPDPAVFAGVRLFDFDGVQVRQLYGITAYLSAYGASVAGGDMDAGDIEEVVTAPGPDPAAPAHIIVWEWDPLLGINPDGARLQKLGPDDFVWGSYTHGATVAVGAFQ